MIHPHYRNHFDELMTVQGEALSKDIPAIDAIIKKYGEQKEFLIFFILSFVENLKKEKMSSLQAVLNIPL